MIRPSKKQLTLAHWWHRPATRDKDGVIADGAIRSGKTHGMITGFMTWSRDTFTGECFIVAGKSMGALKRNVVRPMLKFLRTVGWEYTYNRSEGFIDVGGNTYYLFGANNEASQDVLQGLTAAGCYADEVALFPKSFVDQMVGRCSVDGSKMWLNCNPSYPTHFFKTEWVDRADELNLLHLHFDMTDNPSLSDAIRARYERMFTGVFYDRYIRGLWTLAEGLVYPRFQEALEDRYEGPCVKHAVSCDYGTQNAFAALLWGWDGRVWHVIREYRYSGRDTGVQKTDVEYVEDMAAFVAGIGDVTFIVDPSAASFIAAMRKAGMRTRKARNDVMDGIRETSSCMVQGLVRIARDTPELQKEFAGYVWDEKAGDAPVKVNDHLMDALRYGVATLRIYQPRREARSRLEENEQEHNHHRSRVERLWRSG